MKRIMETAIRLAREGFIFKKDIREDDLAQYHPRKGQIVQGEYRGHTIVSRGDQCDGASVIEALQILEHFDMSQYNLDDPEYIHLMAQALYIGNADEYLPYWQQVSKTLAKRRKREIDLSVALPVPAKPKKVFDGDTNHLSAVDAFSIRYKKGPPKSPSITSLGGRE